MKKLIILIICTLPFNTLAKIYTTYGSDGYSSTTYDYGTTATTFDSNGNISQTYRYGNTYTTYNSDGTISTTYAY